MFGTVTMLLLRKLTSACLFIFRIIRKAFCCFRIRTTKFSEPCDNDEVLTHVGIVPNRTDQPVDWNESWQDDAGPRKPPNTVDEHIKAYREKNMMPQNTYSQEVDTIFKELTPTVVPAPRVTLRSKEKLIHPDPPPDLSRLAPAKNYSVELGEWEDEGTLESGWDEQQIDPRDIIRQYKRSTELAA